MSIPTRFSPTSLLAVCIVLAAGCDAQMMDSAADATPIGSDAAIEDGGERDAGMAADATPSDAGGTDASGTDAGGIDVDGTDAGGTDADGTDAGGTDAGGTDAGGTDAGGTDAGGSDAGTTTTSACAARSGTPVSSQAELDRALASATGGETIIVAGGSYGRLNISRRYASTVTIASASPTSKARFSSLRIRDAANVLLDCVVIDYRYSSGDFHFLASSNINNTSDITIQNTEFAGDNASGTGTGADGVGNGIGVRASLNTNLSFINNHIHTWWTGILIATSTNVVLSGNEVTRIRADGMDFDRITGLTIERNYIHGFRSAMGLGDHRDMIQILRGTGASRDIIIRNNIFDNADGLYTQTIWGGMDGSSMSLDNVLIENNLIYNAHTNCIALSSVNRLIIRQNSVIRVPTTALTGPVAIPTIGSTGPGVILDSNVVSKEAFRPSTFRGSSPSWTINNNVFVQFSDATAPNYFDDEFVYHARASVDGHNEFGVRPGGAIATAAAGSTLANHYPLGRSATLTALRALP